VRVLVTGGLGFIGSFTCEHLRDLGFDVVAIDDRSANVVDEIEGVTAVVNDLREVDYSQAGAVVHCASPVGAVALLSSWRSITHEIADTTHHLALRCASLGIPLLNISTSEVYGFSGEYAETDDLRVPDKHSARLEYAVGKIAGEHLLHGFKDLRFTTIRPFNVTGPRQTAAKGFVLPTFVEQAQAGDPLTVFEDGKQERAFTSVYDVARFIGRAVTEHNFDRRAYNVGNPDNRTTVLGLAKRVIEQTDSQSEITFTTGKAVHGEGYEEAEGIIKVPSIARANSVGWSPHDTLDQLIAKTAEDSNVTCR
jgi:nucleoside-diphosphate-sugar epimerase